MPVTVHTGTNHLPPGKCLQHQGAPPGNQVLTVSNLMVSKKYFSAGKYFITCCKKKNRRTDVCSRFDRYVATADIILISGRKIFLGLEYCPSWNDMI